MVDGTREMPFKRSHEYGSFIIESITKHRPTVIYGNVRNDKLIDNLPDGCVEVACLVDRNGVQPTHFGPLPEQLAALNRAHMSVHSLMCDALLERNKEAARYALMLDPLTAAVCSPAEISALFDEMWEVERPYLQAFQKGILIEAHACYNEAHNGIEAKNIAWNRYAGSPGINTYIFRGSAMEQNYIVPSIYYDMSNQGQGYFAFRFTCQQCNWQIDTKPIRSTVSTVTNIADIGIGLLGGFWGRAAEAGEKIYGSRWHQEQAEALQRSWRDVASHFHFCPKCQHTVCTRCFNSQLGLCLRDAPDLRADAAQVKHELNIDAQRQQVKQGYEAPRFNIGAVPSAITPDMLNSPKPQSGQATPAYSPDVPPLVVCPQCRHQGPAGKFCQECGTRLPQVRIIACPGCGISAEPNARFCQECGYKLA